MNTVQKIRQLRKDKNENNRKLKRENSNESSRRRKGSTPTVNLLGEKSPITKERRVSTSSSLDGNLNIVKEELDDLSSGEKEKENTSEKTEVKTSPTTGNEELSAGCKVEEVKAEDKCEGKAQDKEPCTQSLKKDDPYTSVSIKKRSSFGNSSDTASAKETESKAADTTDSCIDLNCNVNYTKLLTDQIMDIDNKLVDFCKSRTDLSGSTAVVAVVDGELLIIGNVGDSRAVMGDLKGSTIPLSFDHKPNQLKERRRIKEAGGFITFTGVWRVAGILATSRALGDFPLKDPRKLITAEPDVLTFSLKDHKAHFVILATDGLWDVMSNEEAVAFVRSHIHERDFGSRSLVLHAYDKGSTDNITALIINLSKLNLLKSEGWF
ncbi:UNVERIFIED_CONTAM: hypothetical protein GTU68_003088 [Idotea baltica]|nr:hypothetical protein [Idotea baltica]